MCTTTTTATTTTATTTAATTTTPTTTSTTTTNTATTTTTTTTSTDDGAVNMDIIKEACVEGCEEAIQAKIMGADRIELCSSLHEDGLTPERKTITSVLKQ